MLPSKFALAPIKERVAAEREIRSLADALDQPSNFKEAFMGNFGCADDSMPALRALVSAVGEPATEHRDESGDLTVDEPLWVHGNLTVAGHLSTTSLILVSGDLKAASIQDCGPDSQVVVLGNCETTALWTSGEFHVGDTLRVKEVVYGTYNDNTLYARRLEAALAVSDDHCFQIDEMDVQHELEDPDEDEIAQWLAPVLDGDSIEPSLMAKLVKEGKPLFVNPEASSASQQTKKTKANASEDEDEGDEKEEEKGKEDEPEEEAK